MSSDQRRAGTACVNLWQKNGWCPHDEEPKIALLALREVSFFTPNNCRAGLEDASARALDA